MDASQIISNVRHKILQFYSYNLIIVKNFQKCANMAIAFGIPVNDGTINSVDKIVKWIKPKPPYVKLNLEGSVGPNCSGAGGIIMDQLGCILAAYAGQCSNVISTELMALHYGLNICIKMGITFVWIEVDAMLLIQIINNVVHGSPQNFYLIKKIKNSLTFVNFYISHIYWEVNVSADWLAKKGCSIHNYEELDIQRLNPSLKGFLGGSLSTIFLRTLKTILLPTVRLSLFTGITC
ncbi:uncharacterized protein LOC114580936 [Dendrobium catenatum]|uniref:uncharacterized protein LOC114580936 n=1 Tax=Dendrobium catenatum TaxID=906689 RepID=UPI0010A012AB|nr:uncharacterized protein LOC114580936 [Dendrobium catenatum]